MSKTISFGYTNVTPSDKTVACTALGCVSNYSLITDVADTCVLNNKTAETDRTELISYRTRPLKKVNTSLELTHPSQVVKGIQYGVQTESVLTIEDPQFNARVDEPIVVGLTIKHSINGDITDEKVIEAVNRTISALWKNDGSSRLPDLRRSAERPVAD